MQQHGSNCFAARLPSPTTLGDWGQKVKIQLFQNMVMLDIEYIVITKCSNMVANILPTDPHPLTLVVKRSKFIFFRTWSRCISMFLESRNVTKRFQIFCLQIPLSLRVKRSKFDLFRTWSCCISNLLNHEM